jgi:hypothetical protein
MRRLSAVLVGLAVIVVAWPIKEALAQGDPPAASEPFAGAPLCLPAAYLVDPGNCLPLGPSSYLTRMARLGLTFPPRPLPAYTPDPTLVTADIQYARIGIDETERAPIYSSLQDAEDGVNPVSYIDPGPLRYVSFINRVDVGSAHFVQLPGGGWMRASPAVYSRFQGLIFTATPSNAFGWIIDHTQSRTEPGYAAPYTGREYVRTNVVQVYDIQKKDGTDWYMIGPNEWIERRYIRAVKPDAQPPQGVDNGRWIEVNLYEQILSVYDHNQLVFATLIASGMEPFYTRPGLFKIYKKYALNTMSGAFEADRSDYYYLEDVPWTMYFDQARALHGAYWRAWFGVPQSHGCVNLSVGDAHWLFNWAKEGDWVYVWDPSGQTPTDPKFYGVGGA